MIITKNFVILNFPKTGSTFIRKVVKGIFYKRRKKNIWINALYKLGLKLDFKELMTEHPTVTNYKDPHGCYDQIPDIDKNKIILSGVRDPYERLESLYKFKWWAKYPPIAKNEIDTHFPNFPDLTFHQYLELDALENEELKNKYGIDNNIKIGNQSIQFIRFFFKNHKEILANLNADYFINGDYKGDLCAVNFIKNENLNEELALFLLKYDFSEEEINYVREHEKVNVTKTDGDNGLLFHEVVCYVNENEWILLEVLSHLGFDYKRE
ncbi:hypothetical protein [Pseudozobellia sp. WGM2]|uniref:hypothetical protein n=1 Tax=Pseudozobellia sp. WGM2 TaxID=2787625 RepID=UPI001AE0D716|nr:hypothetical protein [Pseudozobellia sp. WGM2]